MTMKATTVIDYIVQRLADEGITDCFGLPGDRSLGRKSFKPNL